jgi:hypothetical protein
LLAAPVPDSSRLYRPEPAAAPFDPMPSLEGVEALLGQGNWTVGRGRVGDVLLRSELQPRLAELAPLLPKLQGGALLEGRGASQAVWAIVMVLTFSDADAAERFVGVAEAAAADDAEKLQQELPAKGQVEFNGGAAPAPDGVTGRRWAQQPIRAPGLTPCQLVWYRRGRHVLQLTLVTTTPTDDQLVALAAKVFGRLPD